MKSHGPFSGWKEMLPSSRQHNLELECFNASHGTLGTLTHMHIYFLSLCAYEIPLWGQPLLSKLLTSHNSHLPGVRQMPQLRPRSHWTMGLPPDDPWGSVPSSSCIFLPVPSITLSSPFPSAHWSSISPWPWTIILLHPWTLFRTFISIHLFNGIVNDLWGVNHSQDNGCKKLIDMIFMI